MVSRIGGWLAVILALGGALAVYSWNLWRSPAFGLLADQAFHLEFAREFDHAWRDGDFPPRWAAEANGGRGGLGFVVYPPLFAFLTGCWMRFAASPVEALRLAVLSVTAGSFAAVYYLARGWLSRPRSALAAALVLLLPGVTFVALGRGMFPNYAALAWAGLLLGAGQRAILGRSVRLNWALCALAAAGLLLTHALTAYLLALLLLVVSPLLWRNLGPRAIGWAAAAALAAAALTCWYWLPMLHAGSYTHVDFLAASHAYLDSVFGGGAAPSEGTFARDWQFLNDMGRYIVVAQSLLALFLVFALWQNSRRGAAVAPAQDHPSPSRILFIRALPWVAGFALLAASEPVARLLLHLPRFELTQFAWRWQLLVSLWCGVGLASLPRQGRSLLPAAFGAVTLLFFSPLLKPADVDPKQQSTDLLPVISKQQFEALPALDRAAYAGNLLEHRPIQSDSNYYLPAPFGRAEVIAGEATIEPRALHASYREYGVKAATNASLRLITYNAPGWSASLDGQYIEIRNDPDSGLQIIDVPPGEHRLEVRYRVHWL